MRLVKHLCFSTVLAASLGLAACGGDDGDGPGDGPGGPGEIDPDGTHSQYVVSQVTIPANASAAAAAGRDIDGDGQPDNVLGGLLGSLSSTAGLDIQTPVDESIELGEIILLASVKATDLTDADGVGTWVFFGANADPAPPDHLDGDATFNIAGDSPTNAVLAGDIMGGSLSVGPGDASIQIALSDAGTVRLDLKATQIDADISAGAMSNGRITGAVTLDDIQNEVLPAVSNVLDDLIAEDCTLSAEEGCCADPDSAGAAVLGFFDANEDCMVPLEELEANNLIQSTLFNPDLDLDDDGEEESLSIGLSFSAVGATFDLPAGAE